MKIFDLARMVACQATRDLDFSVSTEDVIEDLAVIYGKDRGPGRASPGWVYDDGLQLTPVTPELEVEGPFFLFQYIGHEPTWHLLTFQSLAEVEEIVLDRFGYFNLFITMMVIIHHDMVLPFQVFFRDASGKECLFDKARHLEEDDFDTKKYYPNPRIEWLPAYSPGA